MTAIELPPFEPDTKAPLEPPPPAPPTDLPPRRQRKAKAKTEPAATAPVQEAPPAQASAEDKAAIAGLLTTSFGVVFEIIASQRGTHWRLSKEEATRTGNAWAEPLAPLLAENSKYVPWAVALLATFGIVAPRLKQDETLKLEKAENAQTA